MSARGPKGWIAAWFIGAVALLFLIEEWLWDRLKKAMALLGRLPGLRRLERAIATLPPTWAAVVFLAPSSLILPIKLFAVKMIASGQILGGTAVILAAKLTATALFARIYVLTLPALVQVGWFVRLQAAVRRWRVWVYAQIEAHPLWRALRRRVLRWRATHEAHSAGRNHWSQRLKAARRLDRMRRHCAGAAGRGRESDHAVRAR
jgi:hypothetical protein